MTKRLSIFTLPLIFLFSAFSYSQEKSSAVSWQEYRNNLLNDPALIAYYDFQEGQGDVLGNRAKSGSILNGAIHKGQWTEGRWQGKHALNFDGGGTYVEIPDLSLIHI